MAFSIPETKIQEVREATEIVDLVSTYVTLKKSGRNFFGLCPFHAEKTPSFSVNPEKQIFHCFGCGAGGNAFTFLMRHEGMSFPEAVKFLAKRAGIELEFEHPEETRGKEIEPLFYANEFAARFFKECLLAPSGQKARDYLSRRGFGEQEIEAFGLGYAPPGWDHLIKRAEKESLDLKLLLRAGLVVEKGDGRYYDRFRDRLMFTILDLSGRPVAFAGRKLNEQEDSPKYVNTPETEIYHKGKLLYGLYQNHDEIRREGRTIFVEGYTDLMSLAAAGIKNVVATSGTALTEDHARLIRRYTRHVVLMYDSDTAGSAATLRGADILLEHGLEVLVAALPEGHDPDSYVRAEGREGVEKYLQGARPLFDFKVEQLLAKPAENRTEAIRSILESLSKIKDTIRRSLLVQTLAEKLEIHEKILWDELELLLRRSRRAAQGRRSEIGQKLQALTSVSRKGKIEAAAEDLVKILIHDWDLAPLVFNNLELKDLEDSKFHPVLLFMNNHFKANKRPSEKDLIHYCYDVDLASFVVHELEDGQRSLDGSEMDLRRWASDCVAAIKIEKVQEQIDAIREEIRFTQNRGESVQLLLKRCLELEEQKKLLEASKQMKPEEREAAKTT